MGYKPTGRPNGRPRKSPSDIAAAPQLTDKQWAAARSLISSPNASLAVTARAAGVSKQAIHQFKADPHFRAGLIWLSRESEEREMAAMVRALLMNFEKRDERRKKEQAEIREKYLSKDYAFEWLHFRVMNDYRSAEAKAPGSWSVESMADGRTYTDPQAYMDHLRAAGVTPVGHLSQQDWEKLKNLI